MSSDPQKPSTWKSYQKGMCEGCWAGCCTLPLEVSAYDLLRLELITEDEAASSLKKASKKLMKAGYVRQFFSRTGVFIMEQRGGRDCVFLGEKDRRCTVYEKRPEVCRQFPKIGPRPGFCPERKIAEVKNNNAKNFRGPGLGAQAEMRFLIYLVSLLPFFILHGISNVLFILIYRIAGYRRKVVQENLQRSFPDESPEWRKQIEKKFYRNFCDLMVETLKTTTISREAFLARCKFTTPENARQWFQARANVDGISSHLANWEWMAFAMVMDLPFDCYAVYKPLSNPRMNEFIIRSRERFGLKLIPIKAVRDFFELPHEKPYLLGLLSDQAPHDYQKAFSVEFLNQKTFYVPGPGLLAVKYNLTPCWGWMRRVGRSHFEWGVDPVLPDLSKALSPDEIEQIARVSRVHEVTPEAAEQAYRIVKEYSRLLEIKIRMAPEDWLWSHRRWKKR